MEGQLGREMQRAFEEEGIKVITGNDFQRVRAPAVDGGADAIQSDVGIETLVDGNERTVTGDALFVATGVSPTARISALRQLGGGERRRGYSCRRALPDGESGRVCGR